MLDKEGFIHALSWNWSGISALIMFFFFFQAKFV